MPSTDLKDKEWERIAPHLPPARQRGRKREVDRREILDAIFYVLRTGCAWRMLLHDFPPYQTVDDYFRQWRRDGTWARINDTLRTALRQASGRDAEPSAAILDSQSVKTTEPGGPRGPPPEAAG